MLYFVGRCLWVLFGLLLAYGGAYIILSLSILRVVDRDALAYIASHPSVAFDTLLASVTLLWHFTLLPLVVGAVLAESLQLRHWLYYAAAGALSGILSIAWLSEAFPASPNTAISWDVPIFLAAGMVASLIYWLVSGRRAGFRRIEPTLAPSEPLGDGAPSTGVEASKRIRDDSDLP